MLGKYLPKAICNIIEEYGIEKKLRKWIHDDIMGYGWLSEKPNSIKLLKQNPDKIDWYWLRNHNANELLEQKTNKINWDLLSENHAIELLEQKPDKINWDSLSKNPDNIYELVKPNLY